MDNPVGGIKRGWEEIKSLYERIFHAPSMVYVKFYDYTLHESGNIFYAVGRERGEFRIGETVINLANALQCHGEAIKKFLFSIG